MCNLCFSKKLKRRRTFWKYIFFSFYRSLMQIFDRLGSAVKSFRFREAPKKFHHHVVIQNVYKKMSYQGRPGTGKAFDALPERN